MGSAEESYDAIRKKRAKERKRLRLELQERRQGVTDYWSTHEGKGTQRPTERVYPEGFTGQMYPTGRAAEHPMGPTLKEWATKGCPVDTGEQWTWE